MVGDDDIRKSLREVADFLRERAEETGYGFARPEDPNDFTPDAECTSEQERDNHRLACEAWNRGERSGHVVDPERSESAYDADGKLVLRVLRAPWGIGSYVFRDEQMVEMARKLDAIADELPMSEEP